MDKYSIVTNHNFVGPSFYYTSGTYEWNIVENSTKKVILTITDTAKITYNYYWEHVAEPKTIKQVTIKDNIVTELRHEGNGYKYELFDDNSPEKRVITPTNWQTLIYSSRFVRNNTYYIIFKNGVFCEINIKKRINFNNIFTYIEFEKNEKIFDKFDLNELFLLNIGYNAYFVAKYNSSITEIFNGYEFFKNDSLDIVINLMKEGEILTNNLKNTKNIIDDLLKTGKNKLVKSEPIMIQTIFNKYLSMQIVGNSIFKFENLYNILKISIETAENIGMLFTMKLEYADLSTEMYLIQNKTTFFKYNLEPKSLCEAIDNYNTSFTEYNIYIKNIENRLKTYQFVRNITDSNNKKPFKIIKNN